MYFLVTSLKTIEYPHVQSADVSQATTYLLVVSTCVIWLGLTFFRTDLTLRKKRKISSGLLELVIKVAVAMADVIWVLRQR